MLSRDRLIGILEKMAQGPVLTVSHRPPTLPSKSVGMKGGEYSVRAPFRPGPAAQGPKPTLAVSHKPPMKPVGQVKSVGMKGGSPVAARGKKALTPLALRPAGHGFPSGPKMTAVK